VGAGVAIHLTIESLEGQARLRAFAAISVFAVAVLTWMIFWMRRHARAIKGELQDVLQEAMSRGGRVRWAITAAAFFAVLREGLEAALFMIATATTAHAGGVLVGALIGLAAACVLGWAVVLGGKRMPMRQFFQVTGVALILFAGGLLTRTVMFLQTSGDLRSGWNNVYDLTSVRLLTVDTEVGRFLGAMFGWDPRPSIEQVLAYVLFVGVVTWLFLRSPKTAAPAAAMTATKAAATKVVAETTPTATGATKLASRP